MTRPTTRAECIDGPRPCPWAMCRYHALGGCALDLADRGPLTLVEVADVLGVNFRTVHKIERAALRKMREALR